MSRFLAVACLVLAGGCRDVTGLEDLTFEETTGQGSGTSSSTAASSGSGGSGGSGGIGPENCHDGKDNDADGAVDCADTQDCEPVVECVPMAPTGWESYARFAKQAFTGAGEPPQCPDGSPALVYYADPSTPETQCSKCACEWLGATCSAPEFSCYTGSKFCANGSDFMIKATNTDCFGLTNFAVAVDSSCALTGLPTVVTPGTCVTDGGALSPAWGEVVYVCLAPPSPGLGGCQSGQACVPKGGGAFAGAACATAPSTEQCPPGWDANVAHAYSGAEDTRACTACACETGATCLGGSYQVFGLNDCAGSTSVVSGVDCKDVTSLLNDNTGSLKGTLATAQPGTCGGGAAAGSLKTVGPLTVCCP